MGVNQTLQNKNGTTGYKDIELLAGGNVDYKNDVWALGVIIYELLTGKRPFYRIERDLNLENLRKIITNYDELFPSDVARTLSKEAKDLIW